MAKKNNAPLITHTEIIHRAIRNIEDEIERMEVLREMYTPKLEALKEMYRFETGIEYTG